MRSLHRLASVILLLLLAAALWFAGTANADVAGALWSFPIQQNGFGRMIVAPNGNLLDEECVDVSRGGAELWALPTNLGNGLGCFDAVTDTEGNSYVFGAGTKGEPVIESVDSTGKSRWTTIPGDFTVSRTLPVLGANGDVYFSATDGRNSEVLGLDMRTGAINLEREFSDVTGLHAFSGGLIVVDTDSVVDYLSYDGTVQHEYNTGQAISAYEAYSNAGGANGTVFVAGYSGGCSASSHASVEKVTPAGVAWTWTDPTEYCSQTTLSATPDGGVVFGRAKTNPSADYTSIGSAGNERWTDTEMGPTGTAENGGYFPIRVDANGVVVLPAKISYSCSGRPSTECPGAQVEFLDQATGVAAFPSLLITGSDEGGFWPYSVAIDAERTYISAEAIEENVSETAVFAFLTAGLGKDYQVSLQEAMTRGVVPPPPGGGGGTSPPPTPPPPHSPPSSGCPAYMVIDSRGSGERANSTSPPGAAFAAELQDRHPSARVAILRNPYPAVGLWGSVRELLNLIGAGLGVGPVGAYHGSVADGEKWLRTNIASEIVSCSNTKLILTGYSQGAQVTGDVYQRSMTSSERTHILAVVLFGDPYFNPTDPAADRGSYLHNRTGVLGKRHTFGDHRVLSYCHLHDPICQDSNVAEILIYRLKQHENYPPDAIRAAQHF